METSVEDWCVRAGDSFDEYTQGWLQFPNVEFVLSVRGQRLLTSLQSQREGQVVIYLQKEREPRKVLRPTGMAGSFTGFWKRAEGEDLVKNV